MNLAKSAALNVPSVALEGILTSSLQPLINLLEIVSKAAPACLCQGVLLVFGSRSGAAVGLLAVYIVN